MTIPEITWSQISRSTKMACGAREARGAGNTLTFKVTIKPGTNHTVTVTLDPSDTYTVKLLRTRAAKVTVEKEYSDIYNDQLSELVYEMCNS